MVAEAVALLYMRTASWSTGSAVSRLPEEAEGSEAEVEESDAAPRLDFRVPRSARSWLPLEESRVLESRLAMPGMALLSRLTWLMAALMKDSTVGKFPPVKTAPRVSTGGPVLEASGGAEAAPDDAAVVVLLSVAIPPDAGLVSRETSSEALLLSWELLAASAAVAGCLLLVALLVPLLVSLLDLVVDAVLLLAFAAEVPLLAPLVALTAVAPVPTAA